MLEELKLLDYEIEKLLKSEAQNNNSDLVCAKTNNRVDRNVPKYPVENYAYQIFDGINLDTIPGMGRDAILVFLSEIGNRIDALQSGKRIILAGSFIKKVQDLHMQVLTNLIYSGKVIIAGREGVAKIYFGYRSEILTHLWKGIYFLVKRQLKSKLPQFRKSALVSVLPA